MAAAEDPRQPDQAPVLNTMEARQGRRGRHAMWVLAISLGLIVLIYGVMVVGVQGTRLNQPGGQTTVDHSTLREAGGFDAGAPARQNERSPSTNPDLPPAPDKQTPPTAR